MTSSSPWFVDAFRADYVRLYAHRDLESARREVDYLVGLDLPGPVLDLCCGYGRHTLALRMRGVRAFGIDLSHDLLAHAASLPEHGRLAGRLVRADARVLPLRDESVGSVVVLFSSFGYFGADGDRRMAGEIARALRPGGRVVLDVMNPPRVRATLVAHSRTEREGAVLEERRSLEDGGRDVVKHVTMRTADGAREWHERVRLYEPAEVAALLSEVGLRVDGTGGDFDGRAWSRAAPRQIVLATKRAPGV